MENGVMDDLRNGWDMDYGTWLDWRRVDCNIDFVDLRMATYLPSIFQKSPFFPILVQVFGLALSSSSQPALSEGGHFAYPLVSLKCCWLLDSSRLISSEIDHLEISPIARDRKQVLNGHRKYPTCDPVVCLLKRMELGVKWRAWCKGRQGQLSLDFLKGE